MKWFGKDWGAPVCATNEHTDTPVGDACEGCDLLIQSPDRGFEMPVLGDATVVYYHLDCFLRSVGVKPYGNENKN